MILFIGTTGPSAISDPTRSVRYQQATSADVPAMVACRATDADAGPADARMARYLDGEHHPTQALPPRTAFTARLGDEVVGYIAGHATTRHLPHPGSDSMGSEFPAEGVRPLRYVTPASGDARRGYECEGEVQYLYVAPPLRRRGVATELLRLLAEWFRERDIRRVCVNAHVDSPGAVPFYVAVRAVPVTKHWYVWDDIAILSAANQDERR